MIYVKNISNKVIGIPVAGGGDSALLPDKTMEVDDAFASQINMLVGFGLIEKVVATEAVDTAKAEDTKADEAKTATEANDNTETVQTEKKTRGRAKKGAE